MSKVFPKFHKPERFKALLKIGIRGVTLPDVLEYVGQGRGSTERQSGSDFFKDNFVAKIKMEFLVSKDQMDSVINIIIDRARTGEIGDGKIFVLLLGNLPEKASRDPPADHKITKQKKNLRLKALYFEILKNGTEGSKTIPHQADCYVMKGLRPSLVLNFLNPFLH